MPIRQVLVFTVEDGDLKAHKKRVEDIQGQYRDTQSRMDKFGAWFRRVFVVGIIAGAARMAARVVESIFTIGAAVQETQSKFNTVFGQSAAEMERFIDSFGRMAGLTDTSARAILSQFGAIFQGAGATKEASAALSEEILKLGADLASFNNVKTDDALNALRSGISGETEPLKRFGILIDDASVKLRALADTGKASADDLTQLEVATARLALIQERAGVAVGDLERTQGSAANTARRLQADTKNLNEELASALVPALGDTLTALDDLSQSVTGQNFFDALREGAKIFGMMMRVAVFQTTLLPDAVKEAYSKSVATIVKSYADVVVATQQSIQAIADLISRFALATGNTSLLTSTISAAAKAKEETDKLVAGANSAIEFHEGVVTASQDRIAEKTRAFYAKLAEEANHSAKNAVGGGGGGEALTEGLTKGLVKAREQADEFFGVLAQKMAEAKAATPELADVLRDLFAIQGDIRDAEANLPFAKNREEAERLLDYLKEQERALLDQRDRLTALAEGGEEYRQALADAALEALGIAEAFNLQNSGALNDLAASVVAAVSSALDAVDAETGARILGPEARRQAKANAEKAAQELAVYAKKIGDQFGGAIPEALKPAFDALKRALQALGPAGEEALRKLGLIPDEIEKSRLEAEDLASALRSLEDAGRVFGFLSDDTRDFISGLANALDNVGALKKGIAGLSSGANLGSILGVAIPGLSVVSGLLSAGSGLSRIFGGGSDREPRVDMEEFNRRNEELADALKDNADRVTRAIDRFAQALQVGGDVPGTSGDSLAQINQILLDAVDTFRRIEDSALAQLEEDILKAAEIFGVGSDEYLEAVTAARNRYNAALAESEKDQKRALDQFFSNLDAIDLGDAFTDEDKQNLRDWAATLIEQGVSVTEIFDAIVNGGLGLEQGLGSIADLLQSTGAFADTIDGAIARLRLLVDLGAVDARDAIGRLADSILDGSIELSDGLRGFLEGIDVSTEEGRQALRDRIAQLAEIITGGGEAAAALLGGQTPEDVQELLRTILGFIESEISTVASEFSNPLEDAANALRIFRGLLEGDVTDALRLFAERLDTDGLPESDALRELIELVRQTGGETADDRKRIDDLIRTVAQGLLAGEFGDDAGTVEALLTQIAQLLDEAEANAPDGEDGFTKSVQIARTITDVQGNEVIIRLSEIRYLAEERNALLEQLVAMGQPFAYDVAVLPNQSAVTNIDVGGVNVYASPSIDEISEALAEQIREALVEAYPNG